VLQRSQIQKKKQKNSAIKTLQAYTLADQVKLVSVACPKSGNNSLKSLKRRRREGKSLQIYFGLQYSVQPQAVKIT